MNSADVEKLKTAVAESRAQRPKEDPYIAEVRHGFSNALRGGFRGLALGVLAGAVFGGVGGAHALRGGLEAVEFVSGREMDKAAHDWVDQLVEVADRTPLLSEGQFELRSLTTRVFGLNGAILGFGLGYIAGGIAGSSRKKKQR